jgi:hypothetical protein
LNPEPRNLQLKNAHQNIVGAQGFFCGFVGKFVTKQSRAVGAHQPNNTPFAPRPNPSSPNFNPPPPTRQGKTACHIPTQSSLICEAQQKGEDHPLIVRAPDPVAMCL